MRNALLWGIALVGALVGLTLLALANLEARPIKGWIQSLAAARGVQLDFDEGRVTLGGVRLRGVRIASPAPDAQRAPQLLSIASIEGEWSLRERVVEELVVRDVAVTLVRSADGTTSLDRFLAGLAGEQAAPAPSAPPAPLPEVLRSILPLGVTGNAKIERVTLTVFDDAAPGGPRTLAVTGLGASAELTEASLVARISAPELRVAVGERELVTALEGKAELRPSVASVSIEGKLVKQTFAAALPPTRELFGLSVSAQLGAKLAAVGRARVLDGAGELDFVASVSQEPGAPAPTVMLDNANLTADLARLSFAVPPELGPLVFEGEPLKLQLSQAVLAPALPGMALVNLDVKRLRWRDVELDDTRVTLTAMRSSLAPSAPHKLMGTVELGKLRAEQLEIAALRASLEGEGPSIAPMPSGGPLSLAALFPLKVSAQGLVDEVTTAAQRAETIRFEASSTLRSPRELDAALQVTVGAGTHGVGRDQAAVRTLLVQVTARDLVLADEPLASRGTLEAQAGAALAVAADGTRVVVGTVSAKATLAGTDPAALTASVGAMRLTVPGLAKTLGPRFGGGEARLELRAPKIALDARAPAKSRGEAALTASFGGAKVEGTLRGSASAVAWELRAQAPAVGPAQRLAVTSTGDFAAGSGQLRHDTTVRLGRATTPSATVRDAVVHLVSSGTTRVHRGTVELAAAEVTSAGRAVGPTKLSLDVAVDLPRPSATLALRGTEPPAELLVTAAVDARRALRWTAKGKVAGLGAMAALLPPGPDWATLAVDIDGQGELSGVIAAMRDGAPILVREPVLSARGQQRVALTVRELRYRDVAETRADVAAATINADIELSDTRKATIVLEVPRLDAVASGVKVGAEALSARLDAQVALRRGPRDVPIALDRVDATLTVRAKTAQQSALPWYGVRAPELSAKISGDPAATMLLALAFTNPGGGTSFEVAGELERADELAAALAEAPAEGETVALRRSLVLQGKLAQVLDGLDAAPDTLRARGKVTVPFRVESGDLSLFRASAQVALADVSASLPKQKLELAKVNGELPVVQELVVDERGVRRVGEGEHGLFSQLRFPDYKPFSGGRDYLSIGELTVHGTKLGPAAGNVRIDRDLVALEQLELLALGGKISGQCVVELRGPDTRVAFRGKATGVRPSAASANASGGPTGDRLDANLALTMMPYRLGLEGRTEIVQIGKDHLLALLDLWDPYRADVSANRVRLGLKVGYPKSVRLHFSRGFANLAIELGGLAGVVRIDEIRGIPVGPVMSHFLAPFLEETPDARRP